MNKKRMAAKMNPLKRDELTISKERILNNKNMPARTKRQGLKAIDKLM